LHDARAVAVRLDIRPRIRLAPDWQPGPRARRRFRLPALALPAAGYWVGMAALTYGFMRLGPHPLDEALAAPPPELAPPSASAPPAAPPEEARPPSAPPEAAPLAAAEPPRALPEDEAPSNVPRPTEPEPTRATLSPVEAPRESVTLPEGPRAPLTFPDFTDSAPTRPPIRAADGPRLDSLFERAERPSPPRAEEPRDEPPAARPVAALLSCEAAVARNEEQLEIGAARGPADITRESFARVLQDGAYLRGCDVPERMVLEICAAVKQGRAVGVTVTTAPPSASVAACVRSAVARLGFPYGERLDVTHTRFDALGR
jgi:hypothetical protein